jgi:hypothetical protein
MGRRPRPRLVPRASSSSAPASRPPRRSRHRVAALANDPGTVASVNVLGIDLGDLVPRSGIETRASGSGRTEYADATVRILRVLVVVEEDAVALLLPPLARRDRGARRSTSRAERQARPADLGVGPLRLDPDIDVDAARAGRLGQPTRPTASSDSAQTRATSRICGHSMPGTGSRSTRSSSGCSRSSAPDRMRVEVDAAEVDDPREPAASSRTISSAVRPTGRSAGRPDPVGRVVGRALLEERLAGGAVDEPLQAIGRPPAPRSAPSATAR